MSAERIENTLANVQHIAQPDVCQQIHKQAIEDSKSANLPKSECLFNHKSDMVDTWYRPWRPEGWTRFDVNKFTKEGVVYEEQDGREKALSPVGMISHSASGDTVLLNYFSKDPELLVVAADGSWKIEDKKGHKIGVRETLQDGTQVLKDGTKVSKDADGVTTLVMKNGDSITIDKEGISRVTSGSSSMSRNYTGPWGFSSDPRLL